MISILSPKAKTRLLEPKFRMFDIQLKAAFTPASHVCASGSPYWLMNGTISLSTKNTCCLSCFFNPQTPDTYSNSKTQIQATTSCYCYYFNLHRYTDKLTKNKRTIALWFSGSLLVLTLTAGQTTNDWWHQMNCCRRRRLWGPLSFLKQPGTACPR